MHKPPLSIVALPHTQVAVTWSHCAYTKAKVFNFVKMMAEDFEITVYAPEGPEIPGAKLVPVISTAERTAIFGADNPDKLPAWPTDSECELFNARAIALLSSRLQDDELLLLSAGRTHLNIANAFPRHLRCEPFCGYYGVIGGSVFAAYESSAHMSAVATKNGWDDIRWMDAIIPPFVDLDDFPLCEKTKGAPEYLLYVGRLIARKGISLCGEIATAANLPLIVAGAGGEQISDTQIRATDGTIIRAPKLDYRGPVGIGNRNKLMANATATLCPTYYLEPGLNVMFESFASGTGVLAPDWGVAAETITTDTGRFFRSLQEAVEMIPQIKNIPSARVRGAANNFSLHAAREKYLRWFRRLTNLRKRGFYEV